MTAALLEKFKNWEAIQDDPDLEAGSIALILYLAKKIYGDYEPSGLKPFILRLDRWLHNVSDETDQKVLVSLLSHMFFAGRGEFESLYRTALTNIYRWIVDVTAVDISDPNLDATLKARLQTTWICPITDSLRINSFMKINGISGHDHRPHWRSLTEFGDVIKIKRYMINNSIERLVLVEDFVGSGNQIESTVEFACKNCENIDIALCPLIICPVGDRCLKEAALKHPRLTYFPAMVLPEEVFLEPAPKDEEPITFTKGRNLLNKLKTRLSSFTFGYQETGAMIVLFSNCPDNTIAIFRQEAASWSPLFPRVRRPE